MKTIFEFNNTSSDFTIFTEKEIEDVLLALNNLDFFLSKDFQAWLSCSEKNQTFFQECRLYKEAGLRVFDNKAIDVLSEWDEFKTGIQSDSKNLFQKRMHFHFRRWGSIAAILVLALLIPWLITHNDQKGTAETASNQVVITTESGKILSYHEVETKHQLDLGVSTGKKGKYQVLNYHTPTHSSSFRSQNMVLHIPKGRFYQLLILEDGTEVYLNAGSSITFPTKFETNKREVELEGEAYFKVAKNPKKLFLVKTSYFTTQVLGTEFNIKAYKSQHPNVTLVEGKIQVWSSEKNEVVILHPGQTASPSDGKFDVREIDPMNYTAWKDGFFYFEEGRLEDIMTEIARWYNIDVNYENSGLKDLKFRFWANKDNSFHDAIDLLNRTGKINVVMTSSKSCLVEQDSNNKK